MTVTGKHFLTMARMIALPLVGLAMMSAAGARAESPLGDTHLIPGHVPGTFAPRQAQRVDITLADHVLPHNSFRSDPLANTYGRGARASQLGAMTTTKTQ